VTIGIRMLSIILQIEGIYSYCITPSVPPEDLVKLCKEVRPDVLGISLFKESQSGYVEQVLTSLGADRPKLIAIGGYAVKASQFHLDPSIYISNPRNIDEVIARIKGACFGESSKLSA
jgi:methanogenic corrinoid protein MtbC1